MKITILKPCGYCAGVARAIGIALKAKEDNVDKDVYILGMLVHNQDVSDYLSKNGIITLDNSNKSLDELIYEVPANQIVIFTAHGHPAYLDEICKKQNLIAIDATCPKVSLSMNKIKEEVANGNQVIYIGYKNHPEVNACLSIDKNVILCDIKDKFDVSVIKDKSPFVINQTTLNYVELKGIHEEIKSKIPGARIANEICQTTRLRQEALINIEKDTDAIIVIGDKRSSNTSRLYELAKSLHPNINVYKIANVNELNINDFIDKKSVAISIGASTPDFVYNAIVDELKKL